MIVVRLLIFSLLVSLVSCGSATKEVVEESFPDGSPKNVKYYKEKETGHECVGEKTFYPNGKVQSEGKYKNGLMEGRWTFYYENGLKWSEGNFVKGKEHGLYTTWFENGNKRYQGKFKNGSRTGEWQFWDENGTLAKVTKF